jgi:hypothetical protein
MRDESLFASGLVVADLENVVDRGFVLVGMFFESFFQGFAEKLEFLGLGTECAPAFLVFVPGLTLHGENRCFSVGLDF